MRMLFFLSLLLTSAVMAQSSFEPNRSVTADEIMARVAENQDRSEALRKQYVYKQRIHIVSHKPGGKLLREETADYDVVPMPDKTEKQLKQLTGRYLQKGKYEDF